MSTGTEIGNVAITTPAKAMTMDANGKAGFATPDNLAKQTSEGKSRTVSAKMNVWYTIATSLSVMGGSGMAYIFRDWGSGGSMFALVAFCTPHGNQNFGEAWKPQIVYGLGILTGMKIRMVKNADKSWRVDIGQPNSTAVTTYVRLPFYSSIVPGDLSEAPALDGTEQVYEYSLSEL